jgi:pyridoxamine 5'-phosphate oxidase
MQAPSGLRPGRTLRRDDLDADPMRQLDRWLADADAGGVALPNAMALATAGANGQPSVRHVLLRGIEPEGLLFFTNYDSRKGRNLAENPRAGVVFLWREMDRQVSATGRVRRLSREDSEAYFQERPREAQIGAWASRQSSPIADRDELEAEVRKAERRFEGSEVPLPPFWGGFCLIPDAFEFWQGREHRLHDRFRYDGSPGGAWRIQRLAP